MAPTHDDSLPSRISPECSQITRDLLHHAWAHDLPGLKKLLTARDKASAQDPVTRETPLHAAIRACGPADSITAQYDDDDDDDDDDGCVQEAVPVLQELFLQGAIWNDVDDHDETPGCVARRLGRSSLYRICVDAGVRAELLFALMGGYEELDSGSEAEDLGVDKGEPDVGFEAQAQIEADSGDKPVTSDGYLQSTLTFDDEKLLDSDLNGVMMSWEADIMRRSVTALSTDSPKGMRILNIGFGMGIIDRLFAGLEPSRHHIIEAHPSVLAHASKPETGFGPVWEKAGPEPGAFKVHVGKWQDVVPKLLEQGETYDAIYFDTFGEDYAQLRFFFTEYVPGLLDQHGRFSFFNGLGADRQICYDVYTRVVDMHCADAGLDVEWSESRVDMAGLDKDGKGQWEGVRRRYWTLDTYRLPVCTFMG
ncbi:Protein arginine N-methyltransferase 2 [Ophiocordyceps camponoti-floridani]|uniref:Arginine N-methyltransferase 2 n=1 Tax=Ophiocordyceps camponoti-floridani TaxID=2030778 RepID=A0A8H4QBZ5_9HYPO|nr:Protein arginine N-methyltransferase 2 [Ophiocordyceps camponoti-floridani]